MDFTPGVGRQDMVGVWVSVLVRQCEWNIDRRRLVVAGLIFKGQSLGETRWTHARLCAFLTFEFGMIALLTKDSYSSFIRMRCSPADSQNLSHSTQRTHTRLPRCLLICW